MRISDKFEIVRPRAVADLGREPDIYELAKLIGCSYESVRQEYKRRGITQGKTATQKRQELRDAQSAQGAALRAETAARRLELHLQIAETVSANPDMLRSQVAERHGVSDGVVSGVISACNLLHKRKLFSREDDNAIRAINSYKDAKPVAALLGRDAACVYQRALRLASPAPVERSPRGPHMWHTVDKTRDLPLRVSAFFTGLTLNAVSGCRTFLDVRRAWIAKT